MNDIQIQRVHESFAQIVPIKDAAAKIFYTRLFEILPEARPLFRGDMDDQGSKLMAMLGTVVSGLRDLPRIVPVAETLAVRHVDYGVEAAHYEAVGQALVDMLERGLGSQFSNEVRDAWIAAYGTLSGVMIAAAYGEEEVA